MNDFNESSKFFFQIYQTFLGKIRISATCDAVVGVNFQSDFENVAEMNLQSISPRSVCPKQIYSKIFINQGIVLIRETFRQLTEYLEGERKNFNLPTDPQGTDFQKKVWNELKKIPYGEVRSYKQIAESTGNPRACRAVGSANNKNPIAVIIPCHRVIGADGRLVGYAGGLERKKFLLNLEKSASRI